MVEADIHLNCFSHPCMTYTKCLRYKYAVSRAYECTRRSLHRPRLPPIFGFWVYCGVEMMPLDAITSWLTPISTSDWFPLILDIYNMFESLVCCLKGVWVHPYIVIPAKLAPDFGIQVTCGLKMMPLRHGWGWHPPQTASHIHRRHIICVWGFVLWSQGLMGAPLYHYTS